MHELGREIFPPFFTNARDLSDNAVKVRAFNRIARRKDKNVGQGRKPVFSDTKSLLTQ